MKERRLLLQLKEGMEVCGADGEKQDNVGGVRLDATGHGDEGGLFQVKRGLLAKGQTTGCLWRQ